MHSGAIVWCIVIGTGTTLGAHHQHVQIAQDAAAALSPLAGNVASVIVGISLPASAVLAVPVLAGPAPPYLADAFGWRDSLNVRFAQAKPFYTALLICLALAVSLTLFGISPIQFLF